MVAIMAVARKRGGRSPRVGIDCDWDRPGAWHLAGDSPMLPAWIGGVFVLALAVEVALNAVTARTVEARSDGGGGS